MIREAVDAYLHEHDKQERLARLKEAARDAFGIAPYIQEEYELGREADRLGREELERYWYGEDSGRATA